MLRFRLRTLLFAMLVVGVTAGLLGRAWQAYRLEELANLQLRQVAYAIANTEAAWPSTLR